MFQVSGDSMLPIRDHSWITCEYIEDWNAIKDGQGYVVVTKGEGIVFKRVYKKIKEGGRFQLVSTNPVYAPYEIRIEDVLEIWKFVMRFSESIMEEVAG